MVTACTRPTQVQTAQNPSIEKGKRTGRLPHTMKLFSTDTYSERNVSFLQWNVTEYINPTP